MESLRQIILTIKIVVRQIFAGLFPFLICCLAASCVSQIPDQQNQQLSNELTIVYPQSSTELVGGQSLRVTILLTDPDHQPLEGGLVQVQIKDPDGDEFAALNCADKNNGRYLCDPITLPLKKSQGVWQVTAWAYLQDKLIATSEVNFIGLDSYSERLYDHFGFWVALPDLFPYNVPNAEDPLLKTYSYDNGGYLILANNLTSGGINNSFVILDVHWRKEQFPSDEDEAVDYITNLAGPHGITLDLSQKDLIAEKARFNTWPSWHVTGTWEQSDAYGNPRPDVLLDWIVFNCPESEWLWTVLITTNMKDYFGELNLIRESFDCSVD